MKEEILKHLGTQEIFSNSLFSLLMEKRFAMKDLQEFDSNLTYRTINHWDEKQYLLTSKKDDKWRKFSFAEYIWLLLLNELRELNVFLESTMITLFIELGKRKDDEIPEMEKESLANSDFKQLVEKIDKQMVLENFCWFLCEIISHRTPITFRIFKDKSLKIIYGNPEFHGIRLKPLTEKYEKEVTESNYRSSISISLDSLIKDYVERKELENIAQIPIFTPAEIEVLTQLSNNDLKEVTIYLSNGKPDRIKLVEEMSVTDIDKRIKQNFFSPYQTCEYKTNGGKTVSFKRSTTRKLN